MLSRVSTHLEHDDALQTVCSGVSRIVWNWQRFLNARRRGAHMAPPPGASSETRANAEHRPTALTSRMPHPSAAPDLAV